MCSLNNIWSYESLGLIFIALVIAIGGIYSYKLFSLLMPLFTIMAIWTQGGLKNISFYISPPFVFLGLLVIWAGMSVFWTVSPVPALKTFMALSVTFIFALLLISSLAKATPEMISKAYILMILSGFFLMLFIIFQATHNLFHLGFFTGNLATFDAIKPTGSVLGLTAFVSCALICVHKNNFLFAFMIFFLLILLAYLTQCQTGLYGIVLATFMFILSYAMPFWMTRFSMIFTYTFLIFSPILHVYVFPPNRIMEMSGLNRIMNTSIFHRFLSWEFYSKKFLENPLLGWGVESSRYLPTEPNLSKGYSNLIHPHNGSAQAYVELGIIGGVLYALFFASLFWVVEKHVKDRLSVAVCNATIAFGVIAAEITHNFWRNYWLSLGALTVGLIMLFLKAREAQLRAEDDHSVRSPTH